MKYINTYLLKGDFYIPETETIDSSVKAIADAVEQIKSWKGDVVYQYTIWIQNDSAKIIDLSYEINSEFDKGEDLEVQDRADYYDAIKITR